MRCMKDKEHGHMKQEQSKDVDTAMIKYTCEYPGCRFTGTDLETNEYLSFREGNDIKKDDI
jgi:hypothetical protein